MSHLLQEYAKSLGVHHSEPIIYDHFYPITNDKYITFYSPNEKTNSCYYDYWEVFIELTLKPLQNQGYEIIEVCEPGQKPSGLITQSISNVSYKHIFHIIKHSKLHLGAGNLFSHIANFYKIPCVALYSNIYPKCIQPVWSNQDNLKVITPDFSKIKPSFSFHEYEKRINEIKPESIAKSVFSFLNINHDLKEFCTINIGCYYNNKILEVVPDFTPVEDLELNKVINLRCDYGLLEESLPYWLSKKVNLMIDKPFNLSLIEEYKENIAGMTIFINDNFKPKYIDDLSKINSKFSLICRTSENISDLRFKFFDYVIDKYVCPIKKDLDFAKDICNNTYYHSNKTLISKNKEYYSKAAWKLNIIKTENHQKLIDSEDFWEEVEHMNIYNHGKIKK
jgi:hypothetical protein